MASSKKREKEPRVVVDIPRSLWQLTKEDKAKLRRAFKSTLAQVRASAGDGAEGDEGDLTPVIDNT